MADTKFSALDPVVSLDGTEIVPVIKGGVPKRTTVNEILARDTDPVTSVNTQTGVVTLNQDNIGDGTTYKQYSSTEKTKLAGVATGATANDTDANLKNRTNHTGSQSISTITGLQTALDGKSDTSHTHSGLSPSGGSTGQVLKKNSNTDYDYAWAADSTGAGGSPGGSDTQIQFNDAGSFGGDADLTWDKTNNDLVLGGTDTGITLKGITNEPSSPVSDTLHFYAKKIAGKMMPKIKGPSGLDTPMQVALWQNNTSLWVPSSATAGTWQGIISTMTSAGTFTVAAPTTTSAYTTVSRGRYANVVTTTNQILGIRHSANPTFFLGNAAGQGGFFFFCRAGFDVWTNGGRMFIGLSANAAGTTVSADPSATNNSVGFLVDAADNGAISFGMRGTSSTKTSTGYTITSGKGYDFFMWASPNSTTVNWRIIDLNAGTENSGSTSTNAPAVNTMMGPNILAGNAALTTVTAIQIGINRVYIETDY